MSTPPSDAVRPEGSVHAFAGLTLHQRRLLAARLRRDEAAAIPRRVPGPWVPLTTVQRGLLVLHETTGGTNAYNVVQALRLHGRLDLHALQRALDELVRRHELLRTRFVVDETGAHGEVLPAEAADLRVETVAEADAASFVLRHAQESFDLAGGRLLRARLAALGDDDHLLVLVSHHIASDAATKQVLNRELSVLYSSFREGLPSPLPEPRLQYADYAAWVAEHAHDDADLQWWRSALAGAPERSDLPYDRPRPPHPRFAGARFARRLDPSLVAGIRAVGAAHRATTYMVLLAAWAALLERYAGQGEVVIGSNVSGRHRPELADVVGMFLNTLPVRVSTADRPSFATLLERTRSASVDVLKHQTVPFEAIVEDLRPARTPGLNPFFQTTLTYKAAAGTAPSFAGLDVTPVPFEQGWAKFDISLICFPAGDEIAISWEYNTDLFDDITVERLADQFETLLRSTLEDPERPVNTIPLAPVEDHASLERWNATGTAPRRCLHQLIEDQVRRTPDAPAVGAGDRWLTYRELDERANRLARYMQTLGVGPETRVGVHLQRSLDLEVALLAVLKAGGAYVPLDPGYPTERLAYMLRDSGAVALLTDSATATAAPHHPVTVDVSALDTSALSAAPVESAVTPDNLAYVIYTSGSTGRPKGVLVEHGGVAGHLQWLAQRLGIGDTDTVLQKTPYSFDVSVWELLLAPMTGARLYMAEPDRHGDPWYLAEVIEAQRVSVVNFVPSMLHAFLTAGVASRCGSLRLVMLCGEAVLEETKELGLDALPAAQLVNIYGPTEASVAVTLERLTREAPVTIGTPMGQCRIHVLDEDGEHEVPIGMPGEVWIGGGQVTRGYHGQPDLTAARFRSTRFGRLYRTGDRAMWQRDGRLRYLGRVDAQVKLRGFRVELGEVESVLATHDDVAAAAAAVTTAPSGEQVLVAYVQPRGGGVLDTAELLTLARAQLPDYMVPRSLQVLPELPRTPSGKIDRRALAGRELAWDERAYIAPTNDGEAKLAAIWRDALNLDRDISTDESFFDIGGSSLLALRLFTRIEREFRVKLAVAMLFENATVASLARAIEAERRHRSGSRTLVTVQPHGDRTPLFACGNALSFMEVSRRFDTVRPVHAVQTRGLDGREAPRTSVEDVARDAYEVVRQVQPHGPYNLMGFCFGGVIAYHVAMRLKAEGETINYLGLVESTPFGRGGMSTASRARKAIRSRGGPRWWLERIGRQLGTYRNVYLSLAFARFGLRIPDRFVDVTAANRLAARRHITPISDLHIDLYRAGTGDPDLDEVRRSRWAAVASGGCDLHLLSDGPVAHLEVLKGPTAQRIAELVNDKLRHSS